MKPDASRPATTIDAVHTRGVVRKLVLGYVFFACTWILLSDRAVSWLIEDPQQALIVYTAKGWLFVVLTSLVLYGLATHLLDQALGAMRREAEAQDSGQRTRQLLSAIIDSSSDAIFAKDLHGHYLLFNRETERLVGRPAEQALGVDDHALFPFEQAQAIRSNDASVIADQQVRQYEETVTTVDGESIFLATKGPLRDSAGQVIGMFGISRNITARKQAEQALLESEERLRSVLKMSGTGGWELDLRDRSFRHTPEFDHLFGYDAEPAPWNYERLLAHVVEADRPEAHRTLQSAIAGESELNFACRIRQRTGDVRWLWMAGGLQKGTEAAATRLAGIARDVTDRKRLEADRDFFSDALRQSSMPLLLADSQTRISYITPAFTQLFGYTLESVAGLPVSHFVPPGEPAQQVHAAILASVRTSGVWAGELERLAQDGTLIPVFANIGRIRSADGDVPGFIVSYLDLRPLRERELARRQAEQTLQERDANFRAMLDASLAGCQIVGFDWRYRYINAAAEAQNRRPAMDLLGRTVMECWPGITDTEVFRLEQHCMEQRTIQSADVEFVFPDGSRGWFKVTAQPVLEGIAIFSEDVTRQKRAEFELQGLNRDLEAQVETRSREVLDLYDHAPCGYHSLDMAGRVLRVNNTELALLGYSREEYVGRLVTDFMTPASRQLFAQAFPDFKRTGQVVDAEFEFLHRDGSVIPVRINANLLLDEHGALVSSRASMIDNRERHAREEEITALNKFLHEVLEVLPFGVVVFDAEQKVILRNRLLGTLLDYPSELFNREPLYFADMVRFNHERGDYEGRSFDEVLAEFTGAMRNHRIVNIERKQANGVFLMIRGQPISSGWTLLTYTDITPHRLSENMLQDARRQAEAATGAKSAFLANMSHEIRTPLNAVLGLAYLLGRSALPGDANELVHKIQMAGRSLLGIINDILDFSKIESGMLAMEMAPFRLGDVLDNLATIMAANSSDKAVELVIIAPPDRNTQLLGDALRLEQVLINLTSNAIKFTERGHVVVAIDHIAESDTRVTLRFAVRDSGTGIAPEIQQEIFQPFAQGDGSTSRRYGGTGLGLTISRKLVAMMGGEIRLASVPGSGSEFWFELNLERRADALVTAPAPAPLEVLIADDHPIAREALRSAVEGLGWRARVVGSGAAAIALALGPRDAANADSVLLLDWDMPDTDGLDVARAVRADARGDRHPIVIMLGAQSRARLFEHPDRRHVDAVLTKPVTATSLHVAISQALRARRGDEAPVAVQVRRRLDGLRIQVVDDSEINREVAQRILSAEGARVQLASDGRQAVDWLSSHPGEIDLVLMDVQMPVLNGYEATREIRRIPALSGLPVVALTAGAFMEQQDLASAAGMTSFIAKPFDVDAAVSLIMRVTGREQADATVAAGAHAAAWMNRPGVAGGHDDLAGIAVARGLDIWRDPQVYRQYLRKFVRDYGHVCAEIAQHSPERAAALAHKLKGAAGCLALDAVAAQASTVDQILSTGGNPAEAIARLQALLDVAGQSIARYAPPEPDSGAAQVAAADAAQLAALLSEMLTALGTDSPGAVRPALAGLCRVLEPARTAALQTAVENFDFRAGEAATRALARDFSVTLGGASR